MSYSANQITNRLSSYIYLFMKRFLGLLTMRALLLLLLIILIVIIYCFITSNSIEYNDINCVSAIIAFFSFLITGLIVLGFNNFQRRHSTQQIIVTYFQNFRSEETRAIRNIAWKVKENWFNKDYPDYKTLFVKALITEKPYLNVSDGKCVITKEDIQSVYDLLAFYSTLGIYKNSAKSLRRVNYFYYAWWRKFLLEVAELYDKERLNDINSDILTGKISGFNTKDFLKGIGFTYKLKCLDKICDFDMLPLDADGTPYSIYRGNA